MFTDRQGTNGDQKISQAFSSGEQTWISIMVQVIHYVEILPQKVLECVQHIGNLTTYMYTVYNVVAFMKGFNSHY